MQHFRKDELEGTGVERQHGKYLVQHMHCNRVVNLSFHCKQLQRGQQTPWYSLRMVVLKHAALAGAPCPSVKVPAGHDRHAEALVAAPPRDQKPSLHISQNGPP
jgi:hypothetical protein